MSEVLEIKIRSTTEVGGEEKSPENQSLIIRESMSCSPREEIKDCMAMDSKKEENNDQEKKLTFLDELYRFIEKYESDTEEIDELKEYIIENEYDSDAVRDEMQSFTDTEDGEKSNLFNNVDNQYMMEIIRNHIRNFQASQNQKVANLKEDILSLAYIMTNKRGKIHCSFKLFLCAVYMIQFLSLIAFVWGYMASLNRDVIIPYSIHDCTSTSNDINSNSTDEWDDFYICDELKLSNITYTLSLVEQDPMHHIYVDDAKYDGLEMQGFGWISLLSVMILSIYTFSAITNPITMLIIARNHDNKSYPRGFLVFSDEKQQLNNERGTKCLAWCYLKIISWWNLKSIAWCNLILIWGSYCIGLGIVNFHAFFFGIENPTDIILTPIGIVFILEIDDWAFLFVHHWYKECNDLEQLSFTASYFEPLNFQSQYRMGMVLNLQCWWIFSGTIYIIQTFYMELKNYSIEKASNSVSDATYWQSVSIAITIMIIEVIAFFLIWKYYYKQKIARSIKNISAAVNRDEVQ